MVIGLRFSDVNKTFFQHPDHRSDRPRPRPQKVFSRRLQIKTKTRLEHGTVSLWRHLGWIINSLQDSAETIPVSAVVSRLSVVLAWLYNCQYASGSYRGSATYRSLLILIARLIDWLIDWTVINLALLKLIHIPMVVLLSWLENAIQALDFI